MLKDTDKSTSRKCQTGNTSIKRSAFCWRHYWSSRFESLWSLLRKFAYLNAINHYEIRKLFRFDAVSQELNWNWCLRSDLRHFGALDPAKLSVMFGIGKSGLAEATLLRYVQEHEASILTSDFLRFCPTCIYQGFHSPLHQLLFLTKCPAHEDRLEIRCPECPILPIPYKLPSVSSKDLSNCIHMMYGLKQHLTHSNLEALRKEAAKREKALLSAAQWLMKRVEIGTPEQPITQYVPHGAGRRYFMRHVRRLPAYWVEVFGTSSRKDPFNVSNFAGTHLQVSHHETSRTSEPCTGLNSKDSLSVKSAEAWDLELFRIYKAIGRHFVQSYLLQHRRCIVRGGQHIRWGKDALTWQGTVCPALNALLLWRMCWEGVDHPHMLLKPGRGKKDYPRPHIYWDPPHVALSDWVLRRLFALECVGLFHECLLLAEDLYRRNAYSFYSGYVKGRRKPHWLIEESEGGKFTVHWWVSRSLSSLFSQSSSHFKSCDAKSCPKDGLY
jgi:hypothetical protein